MSLKPPNDELLADLVLLKDWSSFIYMHDVENAAVAAQNVQHIHSHLRKTSNRSVASEVVEMPREIKDFADFLVGFNIRRVMNQRDSVVSGPGPPPRPAQPCRVIIDASNSYRQQQILKAIRSAQFNQVDYHYVLANFVGAEPAADLSA